MSGGGSSGPRMNRARSARSSRGKFAFNQSGDAGAAALELCARRLGGERRARYHRSAVAAMDLRLRLALLEGRLSRRGAVCWPRERLEAALRAALNRPPRHARCTGAGCNGANGRAARGAQASITRHSIRRSERVRARPKQSSRRSVAVWSVARRPELAFAHGLALSQR